MDNVRMVCSAQYIERERGRVRARKPIKRLFDIMTAVGESIGSFPIESNGVLETWLMLDFIIMGNCESRHRLHHGRV